MSSIIIHSFIISFSLSHSLPPSTLPSFSLIHIPLPHSSVILFSLLPLYLSLCPFTIKGKRYVKVCVFTRQTLPLCLFFCLMYVFKLKCSLLHLPPHPLMELQSSRMDRQTSDSQPGFPLPQCPLSPCNLSWETLLLPHCCGIRIPLPCMANGDDISIYVYI